MSQARIVEQPPEGFEAQTTAADVLVTIDPASARLFRIVQMNDFQPIESDEPLE